MEHTISGVGVLDKSMAIVESVAVADRPCTLGDLVAATGCSRATAHRLAAALEAHGLLGRDGAGRYVLGLRLVGLGRAASDDWPLAGLARPGLEALRDRTGESVQLYVRDAGDRVCLVSLESRHELRTIVPEGVRLPLGIGSAGRLLAGEGAGGGGWVASVEERAPGVASVSAPIEVEGTVVAAVGISGPIERLGRSPGAEHGEAVAGAARSLALAVAASVVGPGR